MFNPDLGPPLTAPEPLPEDVTVGDLSGVTLIRKKLKRKKKKRKKKTKNPKSTKAEKSLARRHSKQSQKVPYNIPI